MLIITIGIFAIAAILFILFCLLSITTNYDVRINDAEQELALKEYFDKHTKITPTR